MAAGTIPRPARRTAAVVVLIAAVALWLVAPPAARWLNSLLLRTVTAPYGIVQRTVSAAGAVVIRDELHVAAPATGRFTSLVSEESRVRAGDVLAVVDADGGEVLVRAPRPGIVKFYWDGWSSPVDLDRLLHYSPEEWRRRPGEGGHVRDGDAVTGGAPVARLVRSHDVHLYMQVPEVAAVTPGRTVWLKLPSAADDVISGKVVATSRSVPGAILVRLERYIPVLDAVRTIDVDIVLARYEGGIVPARALVSRGEQIGVFVRRPTGTAFVRVALIATVGDEAVVEGLTPGTAVVVNPARLQVGKSDSKDQR